MYLKLLAYLAMQQNNINESMYIMQLALPKAVPIEMTN